MNKTCTLIVLFLAFAGSAQQEPARAVDQLLTEWHQAATEADFEAYFSRMTPNAVFVGTDATEHWNKSEFMAFSKPYFDRGNAWSFSAVERHIYFSADGRMAWFDELLDTWMQLCRGSGVAVLTEDGWKVSHYVLSLTMPNDAVNEAIALKKEADSLTIRGLRTLKTN